MGVAFDTTITTHVQACIPGVRAFLLRYLDQGAGEKAVEQWVSDDLKPLAKVTGRDRLAPHTTSRLQPTVEGARGTVRPGFDIGAFDGLLLDNPSDGNDPSVDD